MRGESVSTYPRRPKAEAFSNAVDVVERLRDPTDQELEGLHRAERVLNMEVPYVLYFDRLDREDGLHQPCY